MWRLTTCSIALVLALALALVPAPSSVRAAEAVPEGSSAEPASAERDASSPDGEVETWRNDRRFCSRSARAVLRACKNEADDDYWIAIGKCLNLADEDERRECMAEAEAARKEVVAFCREQHDARLEACDLLGEGPYDPEIDPKDFLSPQQAAQNPNPYFPLAPGNTWRYTHKNETIEVTVTDQTIEILGVTCFVVRDVVRENGVLIEDTDDWYALDDDRNVWYFGEHVKNYEDGVLANLDGSWKAGVDGGKAGLIMKASSRVGDVYRQEFLLGEVEDLGQVLSTTGNESVPAASCDGQCLVTRDFSPVEPGNEGQKHYALGIGLVLEVFPETGEREQLVDYHVANAAMLPSPATPEASRSAAVTGMRVVAPGVQGSGAPWRVDFDLACDAEVDVAVYDAAGRRTRALARGWRRSGAQVVNWNGTDAGDRPVATGIYFLRVQAGGESLSKKLVVIRPS